MSKKLIIMICVLLLISVGTGVYYVISTGQKIRMERNEATKVLQETVSTYIIENYVNIKKIEWDGWEITPLGSVTTRMKLNDFSSKTVDEWFNYHVGDYDNYQVYTDRVFIPSEWAMTQPNTALMQKEMMRQGVKKAAGGSPKAIILYNWEERK